MLGRLDDTSIILHTNDLQKEEDVDNRHDFRHLEKHMLSSEA